MKTLRDCLACAALAALTVLAVCSIVLVRTATSEVAAVSKQANAVGAEIVSEVDTTREALLSAAVAQLNGAQGKVDRALSIADSRIGQALSLASVATNHANDQLGVINATVATFGARTSETVAGFREDLKPTLSKTQNLIAQIDDAAPMFLDCDHNADCLFNRYVGASKGIERASLNLGQMAFTVNAAMPQFVANANSLVADSAATAGNLNRLTKPKWYDRLIGYGLNAAVIYRNLNPVTNVTVKAAQILTSR